MAFEALPMSIHNMFSWRNKKKYQHFLDEAMLAYSTLIQFSMCSL